MKNTKNDLPVYFIGPRSENRALVLELLNLLFNDHIFWRRNYHPQDPPVIHYAQLKSPANIEFQERLINELFKMLAELKLDPPFFSPRYMAHMISEPLLPGLIAYIATIFYNPNNIASDASPITMKYELEVGKQFSKLFGFDPEKSFGHITSGGTVANYESLYYNINLRFLPLSFFLFLKEHNVANIDQLVPSTLQELCNIPYEKYEETFELFNQIRTKNSLALDDLQKYTYSNTGLLGLDKLIRKHFDKPLPNIKIVVPQSSHYSWSRGAKLLGLGIDNLEKIKLNSEFQLDTEDLKVKLENCQQRGDILLELVGVYGSTEMGCFDPIKDIVDIRQEFLEKGLYFPIHIDAAYGGYFSSLFHENGYAIDHFPNCENLKITHKSLANCESITVDPHKLGYAPYGAGAFIFKHGELKDFIAESAAYCFAPKGEMEDTLQLGKYILEGSKPGASAAAVYFNHKIIPLNYNGYGKILKNLCATATLFFEQLSKFKTNNYQLIPLLKPQSNIVCFFIKPKKDKRISSINKVTNKMAGEFGIKNVKGIQEYEYIVSNTTLKFNYFSLLPTSLDGIEEDEDHICLIRMVFMNQWHAQEVTEGTTHLTGFLKQLNKCLEQYEVKES